MRSANVAIGITIALVLAMIAIAVIGFSAGLWEPLPTEQTRP